ncbi:MAG: ABC transporter permease [Candidatus Kapabacteria bacterium]|nr:ABC transporter permease [Candidatus Kapabacteria bacterium]MDW8012333.1 FtsX-like permease family protein [Bacteroidota bacterium]
MASRTVLWLLLWRWLLLRRRWGIIQIIAALSVVGIGIGTATLLSVLSIFKGFHQAVQVLLLRYEPHLRILPARGQWLSVTEDTLQRYARTVGARAVLPMISQKFLLQRGESFAAAVLIAAPEEALREATDIEQSILAGEFDLRHDGLPTAVAGAGIAERLRLLPGDTVRLWSPAMIEQMAVGLSWGQGVPVQVVGIFQAPAGEEQSFALYVNAAFGRRLLQLPPQTWSGIALWLPQTEQTDWAVKTLRQMLPTSLQAVPWYEFHRQLYDVLRLERLGTFAVLSLIVVVAVFNVAASLWMSVVQKSRELALLRALGLQARDIQRLYRWQGVVLGVVGIGLGMLGGLGFYWGQQHFGWFRLDPLRYILSRLPVFLELWDVVLIIGVAFALVLFASAYPAWRAGRQQITEALREE